MSNGKYIVDLGANQRVISLLIFAKSSGSVSAILSDVEPNEGAIPQEETSPTLPVIFANGFTKINFTKPFTAKTIELLGSGLEYIEAAIVNNLTVEVNQTIHAKAAGTIDGVNKIFTSPFPFTTVFVNGIAQIENEHYTKINPTVFELSEAPLVGDTVSIIYIT